VTTIKDIAAKINLSVTTVSLVLNGRESKIPQRTKELVIKTAEELHYRPNQLAVGLITKRTKTIGLIVPDIRNSFFSGLAKGIEDECRKNGWTVILCNTSDIHERDMEYIHMLASKGVDGILYCMSSDSNLEKFKECYNLLNKLNIRFIMLDRSFPLPNLITAKLNHLKGGYLATKHLLDLGHTHIACVTGPKHLEDSNQRLKGYMKALKEANIPYDESIIVEGDYHMETGISSVDKLIDKNFSAIFAFNDMMAYGIYKGLKAHGLSVPADVSVIGYDDIFISEILEVPLTTIHQPIERMGAAAIRHLIGIIENEIQNEPIPTYSPKLVIRNSTAEYKPAK
jgi:LacI family transcriptional regulator